MTAKAPRIGLVLGAGGIAGYAFHLGTLNALTDATGWDPRTAEIMVGTSAGSGVSAMIRGNVNTGEMHDRVMSIATDPAGMERLRSVSGRGQRFMGEPWFGPASPKLMASEMLRGPRLRPLTMLAATLPAGRIDTYSVGDQAASVHDAHWPSQALWIPAVSLATGKLSVFGRDPIEVNVASAVEASCAIPGFYQPVVINGHRYVDGGMRSATNASLLAEMDLDLVVVLSPMSIDELNVRSPMAMAIRGFPRMQVRAEIKELEEAGIPTLLLEPDAAVSAAVGVNPMDPTRVVPVMVSSTSSAAHALDQAAEGPLETLRQAGRTHESPKDVPYPD